VRATAALEQHLQAAGDERDRLIASGAPPEALAQHQVASGDTEARLRLELHDARQLARTDIDQEPIRPLRAELEEVLGRLDARHDPALEERARLLVAKIEDLRENVTVRSGERLPYAELSELAGPDRLADTRVALERALGAPPTNQQVWSRFERHNQPLAARAVDSLRAPVAPERAASLQLTR
jgi:hypothetical protein